MTHGQERKHRKQAEYPLESYWLLLDDLELHREELRIRGDQLAEAQSVLESLEEILSDTPLGCVSIDEAGTILAGTPSAGKMLGLDFRNMAGWSIATFAEDGTEREVREHLLRCRKGEDPVRSEVTLKNLEKGPFPCQLVTRKMSTFEGNTIYRTAILDLSDRRRVEEALHAAERRFSAAVEASGTGVFEFEIPFNGLLYVNQRFAEILGCSRSELVEPEELPRWMERRLHAENRKPLLDAYRELAEGLRDSAHLDVRFRRLGGSWSWIRIWAKATSTNHGPRRSVVGAAMDVTAERERVLESERRTQQLRGLATELYHVEERERRELATELHDNLAQLIVATRMKLGTIDLSQTADRLGQQLQEAAGLLDRAGDTVRSLTFSLSPPVLDELGLVPAVKWLAQDVEKQFGLKIEIEERGELRPMAANLRFMLFRSIRELLINAAKHAEAQEARVGLESREGSVQVLVEDKGKGFQWSGERAEGSKGFGLFSIHERIDSIGGTMQVQSAPGEGTSITILVPNLDEGLSRPEESPTGHGKSLAPSDRKGSRRQIRVLLADDHELVRGALARLLDAQADLQVIGEAADGESAVELADLLTPDVVLMDVTMAGLGGIEATRRIAQGHPETRIIGLSMHESADVAAAMRSAGACEYLRKSSPTHVLLQTIRNAANADVPDPVDSSEARPPASA
jgi:PAS domain S-box-containing protein